MISLHKDNKITKRELKDLALNKNLIQVGKKDTLDKEERSDQAAYVALNKNLIDPLMDWKAYLALKSSEIIEWFLYSFDTLAYINQASGVILTLALG